MRRSLIIVDFPILRRGGERLRIRRKILRQAGKIAPKYLTQSTRIGILVIPLYHIHFRGGAYAEYNTKNERQPTGG